MTIVDLTSMVEPQGELQDKINGMLDSMSEDISNFCFQCGKCTSGCEAFILLELEPHRIMALVKNGFIDELVNSDIIWTCMTCFKCKERCPQGMAPVNVLFALKNLAVAMGKQIPSGYTNMLQNVLGTGLIQAPKEVLNRKNETIDREKLNLPPIQRPEDPAKFQQIIMKAATETLR
ncbi:MAG: 4Fe-4S dicluster domain-containing protein [Thermoplasmata archaeon]|nr:4Fe-4S dicluster domain-containing protein [Thermoplasmata archaeon]